MARIKVWGGLMFSPGDRNPHRCLVAAANQRDAAEVCGCSMYHFARYWPETRNPDEVSRGIEGLGKLVDLGTA
ncbi:hypothetical protein LCGC14_1441330 [marine sediment metagenome]|uniref:Uncharacterized protein n=1 Tax=marine sediment metagenome TaxID=412755 RepID=A0A0F9JKK4_9ZZZZ